MRPQNQDSRLRLLGWLGSLLFHFLILILGVFFLVQPARFTVTAGQTSTEIELTANPEPAAAAPPKPPVPPAPPTPATPPPPRPATPPPAPSVRDSMPAVPAPREVSHASASTAVASRPSSAPAKPRPAHQSASAKSSNASKGATEAQPDDLHNDPPVYPDESRIAGEQGVVVLMVEVSEQGNALSVSILHSSGFFRLDQAARRAVLHWKFRPAMAGGIPIHSEAETPVRFKLE